MGGYGPPGAVVPAVLHGGNYGEDITPRGSVGGSRSVTLNVAITAWDASDVRRAMPQVVAELRRELTTDSNGLLSEINRRVAPVGRYGFGTR